jgi:hypothetical protein
VAQETQDQRSRDAQLGLRIHTGAGQVVEVLLGLEHQRARVVDVQKTLQVVKHVRASQRRHIRIRQMHTVAPCQCKHQLRLQRAFDVHVQLGLGHAAQQLGQAFSGQQFHVRLTQGYYDAVVGPSNVAGAGANPTDCSDGTLLA